MLAGWSCIRLNDGPNIKLVDLFQLVGTGLSLVCCLVIRGSTGVFFCFVFLFFFFFFFFFCLLHYFSGVVSHPRVAQVSLHVSVESSSLTHQDLIHDLFVPYVDSLMGKETFMQTKCVEPLQKLRARVRIK